jgi:hypothetical protein
MVTEVTGAPFYCIMVLLKITFLSFVYGVTVLRPYSFWISAFWAFKELSQKRSRILQKSFDITRLIGFVWSIAASVVVCVSDFEFTSMCPFKSKRVPEYLIFIYNTSENAMKIAPPIKAPICVTSPSGTNSQILLPISAELSFSTLSITIPNDTSPKEIVASRPLKKINYVSKIPRIYSIAKKELSCFSLKKLTKSRSETDEEEIMPKQQRNPKYKHSQYYFSSTRSENAEEESRK